MRPLLTRLGLCLLASGCSGGASDAERAEFKAAEMDNSAAIGAPRCEPEECARVGGFTLPNGEVMVFSGADRDEVQGPGTGVASLQTERFDPATQAWTPMASQHNPRTYHNTAVLLPDGRVLVGGHAPINTAYAWSVSLPGFSPNDGRDPSFEIYSPPYVFGPRPRITRADPRTLRPGEAFVVPTHEADAIDYAVLVRRADLTHLIDADQRSIVLPVVSRSSGKEIRLRMPRQRAVVPPGEYMLFIVDGKVPSVSVPVSVPAERGC
jgi:hypothetical protein